MTRRLRPAFVLCVILALMPITPVMATGGGGGGSGSQPGPSSEGTGAVTHGKLVAGAGGTYLPILPVDITPTGTDPRNPLGIPPPGPNPQGTSCPESHLFHVGPGSPSPGGGVIAALSIHPGFAKNAAGGYDGYDAQYAYTITDAIPAGGNAADTAPGSLATAANVDGHVIAVTAFLRTRGSWQDAQPVAPFGGRCVGATFSFSPPYLAGNAPPPAPPSTVLNNPPFPIGANLVAALTKSWVIGGIDVLPGGVATSRTFVHIPTCVWTDSTVPVAPVPYHALTTTVTGGYTLFLLYDVTVTPGPVSWNWGDGASSTAAGPIEQGPALLPSYDPSTQQWTDPCAVSHNYAHVANGVTITATESFTVSITVSWSDGVAVHTMPVACDAGGGACALTVGPGDGWQSGPHPVDQIEPVPYQPPAGT
ncbi:MAG: hypothetical protein ABSC35_05695 [Candidatus Dormibacteria bacterium]|jgi:hypothetical protein